MLQLLVKRVLCCWKLLAPHIWITPRSDLFLTCTFAVTFTRILSIAVFTISMCSTGVHFQDVQKKKRSGITVLMSN